MSPAVRVGVFLAGLVLVFAAAFGIGSVTGSPIDRPAEHAEQPGGSGISDH